MPGKQPETQYLPGKPEAMSSIPGVQEATNRERGWGGGEREHIQETLEKWKHRPDLKVYREF